VEGGGHERVRFIGFSVRDGRRSHAGSNIYRHHKQQAGQLDVVVVLSVVLLMRRARRRQDLTPAPVSVTRKFFVKPVEKRSDFIRPPNAP
jgi:hypothetical protein